MPIVDYLTGLYASIALCAAIAHRERTGEGQHIDCALLDTAVAANVTQAISYFCAGEPPGRLGNAHPQVVPYEVFPTLDGHMILAVANDGQFRRFCQVIERPALAGDPRFVTNSDRVVHRKELLPIIRQVLAGRTKSEWLAALEAVDVACGPINNFEEVFEDPQVRHRGLRVDVPHALGDAPLVANPMRLSATPVEYRHGPPLLGQHTDEVLGDLLGMSEQQIDGTARRRGDLALSQQLRAADDGPLVNSRFGRRQAGSLNIRSERPEGYVLLRTAKRLHAVVPGMQHVGRHLLPSCVVALRFNHLWPTDTAQSHRASTI